MAIVERDGVQALTADWDRPAVYLLLDRHEPDGTWGCYAGKAATGVRSRLLQHVAKKDHWHRALLVQRDTTFGFNSAQVGWLEGRLYDYCTPPATPGCTTGIGSATRRCPRTSASPLRPPSPPSDGSSGSSATTLPAPTTSQHRPGQEAQFAPRRHHRSGPVLLVPI